MKPFANPLFVTFANYLTRLGACQIFGKRYESLSSKGITKNVASGSLRVHDLLFVICDLSLAM